MDASAGTSVAMSSEQRQEYIHKHSLEAALSEAVSQVIRECHSNPKQRIAELLVGHKEDVLPPIMPVSAKKDCNAENMEAFRAGVLKHAPPKAAFYNPKDNEGLALNIKEIKLPKADQTHEVCFEPVTKCVFVSQMSNCTLVRIPVDINGFLVDDQDAWVIGECNEKGDGIGGMHNISLSYKHPGCLWISLQYANQLLLVDVTAEKTLLIKQIMQVPTYFTDPATGETVHVGGPHCMRECPVTGDVWAGLKGALKDAPCGERSRRVTGKSSCCDPEKQAENMAKLAALGLDCPPPDGWAVWRITPSEYDPQAAGGANGGTLYPCFKSPPMLDFDHQGNCYVPQDGVDTMLVINRVTGACDQLSIPFPASGSTPRITGPAVGTAPNGQVFITQLGSYNALVRIDPTDGNKRTLYELGGPPWCKKLRLIHLAFSSADGHDSHNRIYALASDLLDDEAVNAVVVLRFCDGWKRCLGRRIIPLPTQDCACHRVAFMDVPIEGRALHARSIAITELASSKLLQIKVRNILDISLLEETITTDADGFEVRRYSHPEDGAGAKC